MIEFGAHFELSKIQPWLGWLNASNFFSALCGAYFGAWAAQKIAIKSKERDDLIKEIRNANVGIALAASACSAFINVKFRHVRGLKTTFEKQKDEFEKDWIARSKSGVPVRTLRPNLEIRTFRVAPVDVKSLEETILDKLSAPRRAIAAVGALKISAHSLCTCADEYWQFVEQTKSSSLSYEERALRIFGFSSRQNVMETTAQSMIDGIDYSTDSCIYLSQMLCSDLAKYGKRKREEFIAQFGGNPPEIEAIVFTDADAHGLMPSGKGFETWNTNFAEKVSKTKGRLPDKVRYRLECVRRLWRRNVGIVRPQLSMQSPNAR